MENHLKHGNEFANNQDEKLADKVAIRIMWFLIGTIAGAVLTTITF